MPILDISEYVDSHHGNPIDPPVAHQQIPLGPAPAVSAALNRGTRLVRIVANADCWVGIGADPQASQFLTAGLPETRVIPEAGFCIAARLAGRHEGGASDQVDSLLALIANPAAAAKRKAELQRLERSVKRKSALLATTQDRFAAESAAHAQAVASYTQEKAAFEAFFAEHDGELSRRETALAAAQARLESETAQAQAAIERREVDVTKREDAVADRARLVLADEAKVSEILSDLERRRALAQQAFG